MALSLYLSFVDVGIFCEYCILNMNDLFAWQTVYNTILNKYEDYNNRLWKYGWSYG